MGAKGGRMGEKVTFNEITKIITVTLAPDANGEVYIDVKTDLYSDGKEDWVDNENLRKFVFPVRSVGGDDLPGSKALGATFFLAPDWKIRPYEGSHKLTINGNLYSEDGSDMFLDTVGTYTVRIIQQVSSLVDSTVQQLEEIEYASFGGGVTINVDSDVVGTSYPAGTIETPVNNLTDAKAIAMSRGFDTFFISKSMSLDSGTNIEDFNIIGKSEVNTEITIDSSAICSNISISHCNVSGTLDGGTTIHECHIGDLTYVNGSIHNSGLYGTIILDGNEEATLIDCYTFDQDSPPIIDMGGSGQDLAMPNYSGIVTVKNLSSASEEIGIGIDAGIVILEDTITAGTIIISGIGILNDNSTGTAEVNTDGLMNKQTVAETVVEQTSITSDYAQGSGIGNNQIQLAESASSLGGAYDPSMISITTGSGIGQTRLIYQYDGSTKTATVDRNWKVNPDATSKYIIHAHPGREHVNEGLARGGTTHTITLNTLASSIDDNYIRQRIFIKSGFGEDQVRTVIAYDGTTKVATVDEDWNVIPDNTSGYVMIPARGETKESITEAIWGGQTADHNEPTTFGGELATKADIAASASTEHSSMVSGTVIEGTEVTGPYTNTFIRDNVYWQIQESATTGLTVEMVFNLPGVDNKAGVIQFFGRYEGQPNITHFLELWFWNYEVESWELLAIGAPGGNTSDALHTHEYYERHIDRSNDNEIKVRLIHNVTTYNPTHNLYLDFVVISSIKVITAADISEAVWTKDITAITTSGTSGKILYDLESQGISVDNEAIAAALLNEPLAGYTVSGSFGYVVNEVNEDLKRALGLLDENSSLDQQTYNVNDRLLSARKRTYSDKDSVGTDNDVIATYNITSTWSGNQLTSYKVVKV